MAEGRSIYKNKKWIWTAVVVCYIGLIYKNSLTPAVISSRQSGTVLVMIWNLFDRLGLDGSWITEHMVRKSAHFAEYTLLGILLWNCVRCWRLQPRFWLAVHAWLGVVIPLVDETLQLFTEGRSGQVDDVWLDVAGICFGTMAAVILWKLWGRLRGKEGKR